jgi:ferritin-like metal-binding protein YciE
VRWTAAELRSWHGREALDAEAEPVGEVAGTLTEPGTGAPRWLAVRTGAHGDEVTPVPAEGAEPTGTAVRLPHPAATIRAAPHLPPPGEIAAGQAEQIDAFYGEVAPAPDRPQPAGGGMGTDPAVVESLRAIHALEREALTRLQGLQSTIEDREILHDVALHLSETEEHEAAVAGRLEELGAGPSHLRDAGGAITAKAADVKAKLARADLAALLEDALAFEQRECAAYDGLAEAARAAGDDRTGLLAERNRADERAMADTIATSLRRFREDA